MALLAWIILPLLLLVAVPHELGHLLVARRFGVTVREFGLGLPPRAFWFSWKGIRWSVNWLLPFGAFVKLKGEDHGSEADDFAALPPGRRALVVLAGPVANLLVACLALFLSGLLIGQPTGLRQVATAGGAVHLQMGYAPIRTPADVLHGFGALTAASDKVSLGPQPAVLGWVGLAQVMDELADVDIPPLAWFLALLASLSIGLGVMNLLPIPPLDGGRIFLYAIEALRRRGPVIAPQRMSRVNLAGLAVLIAVFAAVTGTDLFRLLSGQSILAIH
jgi:membrane-associated protease RseP (regulator of RpoE activity)